VTWLPNVDGEWTTVTWDIQQIGSTIIISWVYSQWGITGSSTIIPLTISSKLWDWSTWVKLKIIAE
jgi:oligoribonuclease NrnB/cAMP/cGMP phosphodiesterase (DHH superfamily)